MQRVKEVPKREHGRRWREWGRAILSILYPPRCVACGDASEFAPALTRDAILREGFCELCRVRVFALAAMCPVSCRACGHPLAAETCTPEDPIHPAALCRACRTYRPLYRRAQAPFVYEGAIRDALHRFKYDKQHHVGRVLGELFAASLADIALPWERYDFATPVPLHPRRLRERGFQQAWVLLHALSLAPHTKKHPALLERTKHTDTQAGLQKKARLANLSGAIRVRDKHQEKLRGAHVLLIDDVLTTGATANACAAALLDAGTRHVDVLTLCRAVY